jgi:hypothetical protein
LHYIELADNCSAKRTHVLNQIKKALKDQWSLTDLNFVVNDWKTILPILKEGGENAPLQSGIKRNW